MRRIAVLYISTTPGLYFLEVDVLEVPLTWVLLIQNWNSHMGPICRSPKKTEDVACKMQAVHSTLTLDEVQVGS